jgi:hypothetical protein
MPAPEEAICSIFPAWGHVIDHIGALFFGNHAPGSTGFRRRCLSEPMTIKDDMRDNSAAKCPYDWGRGQFESNWTVAGNLAFASLNYHYL